MSSEEETTKVLPIWGLAIPLPAVLMITVSLYMIVVAIGFWIRYCLKDRCSCNCFGCCENISICDQCHKVAETCDCSMPDMKACWDRCPSCPSCDCWGSLCSCTCTSPDCDTCHCLCFEIRIT
ncbi:uncharacterized protein si:ch211-198p11.6 [Cheilinus undulatus]|uniref:uncharacterized protein si:ch211-198p11.6 n=1 Tax=Cheilinus undulatus TaxID=241271 RepID=UPI001BD26E01|nr:uncharacterized protein si:ch211-198p11.6 [Cheilinus undulatus]